jgi:LEA14-like dessication related protein
MLKKILLTIVSLIVVIVGTFFIWRYYGYVHDTAENKTFLLPRLEIAKVTINSLTDEKTEMTISALIKNQLPVSFTADSLQYTAFIDGNEVMKDHYEKTITLGANDSSLIALPVSIFNQHLISLLKNKKAGHIDSVEYSMHISFFTRIIFKRHFDIDIKRRLPLIHTPEIKIEQFKIAAIDFKGATINITVSVKNENVFPIKANNVTYQVAIENNKWINGEIPGIIDIPEKGIAEFKIPVTLTFKEAGKALWDLLRKSKDLKYNLHLSFKIDGGDKMIRNSEVIIESEGSVRSILEIRNK